MSRQRLGDPELGRGVAAPAELWFAIAEALGRYIKLEFARDPLTELADAGHLDIQELVLRVAIPGGWQGGFELATKPADPSRSIDVPLVDALHCRLAIVECWNTFGDLGRAVRSSDRKLAEVADLAVVKGAQAGEGAQFEVGLCWVVRDTRRNREVVARYEHIFSVRFPGSSQGWVNSLTKGTPMPAQPGLVWCNVRATRLFAHRRARAGEPQPTPR